MMTVQFHPFDAGFVAAIRAGGPDACGQAAEPAQSDGVDVPCRSCLRDVPVGQTDLTLAARPFGAVQPYAETGPIFLCAAACEPWQGNGVPPILRRSPDDLLKGYAADQRIIHGTGRLEQADAIPADAIPADAEQLFARADVAYVDVRSARNNCFQSRITRQT